MNKTKNRLAVLAIAVSLSPLPSFAGDGWISVGKGPNSEGSGTSVAIGFKGEGQFGIQLGVLANSNFDGTDVLDYPVPHTNYTNLGVKRTANAVGIDGLWFIPAGDTFRPYLGVGVYSGERKDIARSNVTGWLYNQGDKSKTSLTGEAGVQFKFASKFILGAGYHSVRGPNVSIGMQF